MSAAGLAWRPFTRADWDSLAGFERWAAERSPLVAELRVDGVPALAVVDRNGAAVLLSGGPDDEDFGELRAAGSLAESMRQAMLLRPEMTRAELTALGFHGAGRGV